VAAIAGSVAEPLFGMPVAIADKARGYLAPDMLEVLERFERVTGMGTGGRG
jgi:hypothetical protein